MANVTLDRETIPNDLDLFFYPNTLVNRRLQGRGQKVKQRVELGRLWGAIAVLGKSVDSSGFPVWLLFSHS